jgi:hypothetical protein
VHRLRLTKRRSDLIQFAGEVFSVLAGFWRASILFDIEVMKWEHNGLRKTQLIGGPGGFIQCSA